MANFQNIEAVILDKDGVFVNFQKLWLRIIACRAQLIAEISSETSEMLVKVRTACIRAMGVDEEDETIDPHGPCSMPITSVKLALATALFITRGEADPHYQWLTALKTVERAIEETKELLNVVELSEAIPGSVEKIQELSKAGFKIGIFSSDSEDNVNGTLNKFGIDKSVNASNCGNLKDKNRLSELCEKLKVKPENTLVVTDTPNDLNSARESGAKSILVLSGVIREDDDLNVIEANADLVINSLADLDLATISSPKKKVAA